MISLAYDLQDILSEGDFHIFINSLLFNNPVYFDRFNIESYTSMQIKNQKVMGAHPFPNHLCQLFCHWSYTVIDYIHKLLVFKIINAYVIFLSLSLFLSITISLSLSHSLTHRNENTFTNLQNLLISSFEKAILSLGYYDIIRCHCILHDDIGMDKVDFVKIGKKMIELWKIRNVEQIVQSLKIDINNHSFVKLYCFSKV